VCALACDLDVILQQLGCKADDYGLVLPAGLPMEGWATIGRLLGRQQHALQWRIGDWWNYPHSYGDRLAIVESEAWDGPDYSTCAHAGRVANAFEFCRRRQNLTFTHHLEVAHLPAEQADQLLDWCEETLATTGKPRPTRVLREEINRRVERITSGWPATATVEREVTLAVVHAPAWPQEEREIVMLPSAPVPRLEPEVREQFGGPAATDNDQEAIQVVIAELRAALRKEISASLRERLQQCLRILAH
jgi:hypothetical protein